MAQAVVRRGVTSLSKKFGFGMQQRSQPRLASSAVPSAASKRSFSAGSASEEDLEESVKWRNLTVVGYVVCTALTVYNFAGGHTEGGEEKKEYSYLHIRNKEFPWGPDGLFEYQHEEHEE